MAATLSPVVSIDDARRAAASPGQSAPRPVPGTSDLRIDGWLVQPMLNLLSHDDVKVRIRAQLMDLLVCLASRPGKVFRKDELVAEVWEGRWIAESALSRCVAELRSALGDDAHQPRVIETITKRGYRLIAPVQTIADPDREPSAPPNQAPIAAVPDVARDDRDRGARAVWQRLVLSPRRPASFRS